MGYFEEICLGGGLGSLRIEMWQQDRGNTSVFTRAHVVLSSRVFWVSDWRVDDPYSIPHWNFVVLTKRTNDLQWPRFKSRVAIAATRSTNWAQITKTNARGIENNGLGKSMTKNKNNFSKKKKISQIMFLLVSNFRGCVTYIESFNTCFPIKN